MHDMLQEVRELLVQRLKGSCLAALGDGAIERIVAGKLLRSRMAFRLAPAAQVPKPTIITVAAVVEMVHSASLLHDDVLDCSELRRGGRAFWQRYGTSGAILAGDLLFCDAAALLASTCEIGLLCAFTRKVREMCNAEAEEELMLRDSQQELSTWLDIARRKTGPLFAFIGQVCGGGDEALAHALEEAGYRLGTAYQLADDVLDGNWAGARKATPPFVDSSASGDTAEFGNGLIPKIVAERCNSLEHLLQPWPMIAGAMRCYLDQDFLPVLEDNLGSKLRVGARP